jgi:ubiquinone/menaquinone biosynthesis C-methylase UbiE
MDNLLRRRARDLFDKGNLSAHMKAGQTYADVGAGSGHMLEHLLLRTSHLPGLRCVGVDPVWKPIRQVRQRLAKNAQGRYEFFQTGGERLPFDTNSINGVCLSFVLHHVSYETQDKIIDEITRVVVNGGLLILFEDTPSNPKEWRHVERWDRIQNFESLREKHYYRQTSSWISHLASRGFDLLHETPFDKMVPQLGMPAVPHSAMVFCKSVA